MFLWFMPLVEFDGGAMYQSGEHIGGIAYLLLAALLAYAVLSWLGQHPPRIIASGLALVISLLFLVRFGVYAAWGLYGLMLVSVAGIVLARRDVKRLAASHRQTPPDRQVQ
jgi:membrane protein implicated in regulation of membrane protease activity